MRNQFGMVGLGVMGRNLLLNIADQGFAVSGLDKELIAVSFLQKEAEHRKVFATQSTEDFVKSLATPRSIMILVPAGNPVDMVISELLPFLDEGDIIIDGGNSYFTDTLKRTESLKERGFHFMGVGVSGGEQGARYGPSLMPGGDIKAFQIVEPIFKAIAAKVDGEPCVTHLGPGGAGHYVKMIHNGIEYGVMQLISESYHLLKNGLGLSNEELHQVYDKWNHGKLNSYLIEITSRIFLHPNDKGEGMLVDKILDQAGQKGTGKWTSQNAMDLHVPLSVIDMAVTMRDLSSYKNERVQASKILKGARSTKSTISYDRKEMIDRIEEGLLFSIIVSYAQGMAMLQKASELYLFNFNLQEIARIWRGGCIIRASILEDIRKAFALKADLSNILLDENIAHDMNILQRSLRQVIQMAIQEGIPVAGFMASISYFDAYRSERLPLNLIQAQRDFFGAHTYERIDEKGIFHTHWN